MKRFINFGEIKQFRNIIRDVQNSERFQGLDENGEAIYKDVKMPIVKAIASEKIHGTNASVCFSNPDGFWVQSRKNIITPEQDNAGCAFNVESNKSNWMNLIFKLSEEYNIDLDKNIISIFFEWSGGNIQKNSACSGLDKRSIIFQHFKASPIERDGDNAIWYETKSSDQWIDAPKSNIFNIMNFTCWKFEIDFENPISSRNEMIKIVEEEIEPNSPAGKDMGKDGNIGEGMVVTFKYKDTLQRFKIKGEKHSESKVKTLKPIDKEEEKEKIEFVNYACSPSRLEQAWQTVFGIENEKQEPSEKFTGHFLRAVITDIIKEEIDIMMEKNIEPKAVKNKIFKVARTWFMEQLYKENKRHWELLKKNYE